MLLAGSTVLAQDEEFVFGVVLVGPQQDGGWSQSHYEGGQYVEQNLPGARMLVFESLNPADAPEATLLDVVTQMVEEGAEVIFTTSDSFEEDTNTVAAAFPDVAFVNITGSNAIAAAFPEAAEREGYTAPPANIANFNGLMEAPRLLAGCAAALTTETGHIGYLGALVNPETRRLVASTYLGARYCYENYRGMNPDDLTFTVKWIGFWFNIPGVTLDPTEVSNELFDRGADVIVSGIDTLQAIEVAGQRTGEGERVFAIPYGNKNGCSIAPEACIGVAYYNWGPAYLDTVQEVQEGTWAQKWEWLPPDWSDINAADTSVIGYLDGEALPEEVKPQLDEFLAEMAAFSTDEANANQVFLWEGPLNLSDGTPLAAEGEPVNPLDIWFLPQLLEGITSEGVENI
jgi:simple sugar transport system substrate-binding protein